MKEEGDGFIAQDQRGTFTDQKAQKLETCGIE